LLLDKPPPGLSWRRRPYQVSARDPQAWQPGVRCPADRGDSGAECARGGSQHCTQIRRVAQRQDIAARRDGDATSNRRKVEPNGPAAAKAASTARTRRIGVNPARGKAQARRLTMDLASWRFRVAKHPRDHRRDARVGVRRGRAVPVQCQNAKLPDHGSKLRLMTGVTRTGRRDSGHAASQPSGGALYHSPCRQRGRTGMLPLPYR